jgi:AmmeMemoRadiSam system protein B
MTGAHRNTTVQNTTVRRPAVAGKFYPADPAELRSVVGNLLAQAVVKSKAGQIRAVIAPHAGYAYSGPVAATVFAALRREPHWVQRVVVIGPAHSVRVRGIFAPSVSAFATPLGEIPVDAAAIAAITRLPPVVIHDGPHESEHCLEVELPFLQVVFGQIPIVPLLVGSATAREVAAVLGCLWQASTVIVASSDLSHYLPYDEARRRDARTAAAIEHFAEATISLESACGALAVRGLLIAAKALALSIDRVDLRNSGDAAGDRSRVVGYGAWAIRTLVEQRRAPPSADPQRESLSRSGKGQLRWARNDR